MSRKDIKDLVKKIEAQGFVVRQTKNGHLRVWKNGLPVVTLPSTPSDHRSLPNALAALRRAGYDG